MPSKRFMAGEGSHLLWGADTISGQVSYYITALQNTTLSSGLSLSDK